jgi:hypothetical protein
VGCQSSGNELNIRDLFSFNYNGQKEPDPNQLSIINFILRNTYEINTHKMRGENENQVYIDNEGHQEAVYDKNGNLVTNSYNQGSYNYASVEDEPIQHFLLDIAPWLKWGNTRDDPTSFEERLYYYTYDLDNGIQKYIFEGSKEQLEEIKFTELTDDEKEVYYLFLYIFFNEKYKIQLDNRNMERLINDAEYYYEYFYQIQEILNVKQ